ncbi:MAG: aldehyde ferredoxin oxidoreductase family protein [Candidatus Bathyarchaeia archaeon]
MPFGYGKIAWVDLSEKEVHYHSVDAALARKYVGGVGLATKILWDETTSKTEPFSPENLLIFMTGPLTGTIVPSSSRYIVAGISPLTGILGIAHAGGNWAYEFKHAGFDGIIVKGRSEKPVYLWIHDDIIEIRDAQHVWGMDTYETSELLQKETDAKASIACIGPAGEKRVRIACIMNDGKIGRAAARCGLGALMGDKRLKAIVARGTRPIEVADEKGLRDTVREIYEQNPPEKLEEVIDIQVNMLKRFLKIGGPIKNWREDHFEEGNIIAEELRKVQPYHCRGCPYQDLESKLVDGGERHMVWEHWGPLGSNCLISDIEALQRAYSLCNRYGLDTISTGTVIAFAMECFEKGLITERETDGIRLVWGSSEAMLEIIRKIGEREGFGALLGEGVKRATEKIGGLAYEYAMHVKGLEIPAHDPRTHMTRALGYATGSIGAAHMEVFPGDHIEGYLEGISQFTMPELGYAAQLNRLSIEGKAELVAKVQDYNSMLDSLVVCIFSALRIKPSQYVKLLNNVTGWNIHLSEFMLIGERISNLKRMFNVRRGISRKDDTLPPRLLTHRRLRHGFGVPFLGAMLSEYYSYRGWSEEGIPTEKKLKELGLEELLLGVGH